MAESRLEQMEEILVQSFVAETMGDTGRQKELEHRFYELGFEGCREIPGQIKAVEEKLAGETRPKARAVLTAKIQVYKRLHKQYKALLDDFIGDKQTLQ